MEERELLQSVQVVSYFVNRMGKIERISERNQVLSREGILEKQELIQWGREKPKGFKLSSMGLFHLKNVDYPVAIRSFEPFEFERILLEPSAPVLHDLTTVYFIFTRYSSGKNQTRKIKLQRNKTTRKHKMV